MKEKIINFICFLMFRSLIKDMVKNLREKAQMSIWFAQGWERDIQELERDDDARQPHMTDLADLRYLREQLIEDAARYHLQAEILLDGQKLRTFMKDPGYWRECKRQYTFLKQ